MLGNDYFYHGMTRKAVALMGTLFNDIVIKRTKADGSEETIKVPLTYGPREKYLGRLEGDPLLDKKAAIVLPHLGFELTNWQYDPQRKLGTLNTFKQVHREGDKDRFERTWQPVPYNLDFLVTILAERAEDVYKVVEQVVPFFVPDWTPSVFPLEDFPSLSIDVPIELVSMAQSDTYQPNLPDRRMVQVDMGFLMRWNYYGPTTDSKIIKFARVNFKSNTAANTVTVEHITVQPGLTANGQPTANIADTIPYADIEASDDWDYIVQIYSEGDDSE